jgi:hypothetical protein
MGDAGTFMATPVGLSLLAEVAGLDLWDFMEQIGESIPGTTLKASPWTRMRRGRGTARQQPVPVARRRTW